MQYAKYRNPQTDGQGADALLTILTNAFQLSSTGTTPLDGQQALNAFNGLFQLGPYVGCVEDYEYQDAPKAYLNYILFDENFGLQDFGFEQVSTAANQPDEQPVLHELLSLHVKVQQKGYLYIYLSNENRYFGAGNALMDVYFDDFKIVHHTGLEQSNDYYPFGLTYNSYQRENSVDQRWKFQGQEHIDDLALNWDSFKWRNHQPDIGRFFNVDPLAEKFVHNSTYAFSENHVTSHIELEGLEKLSIKNIDNSPGIIQGPWANVSTAMAYGTTNTTSEGFIRSSSMRQSRVAKLEKGNFKGHPEGIVLHRTVNSSTDQTIDVFNSRGFGTHFVVGPDGEITQTARLDKWTQHVGKPKVGNPGKRSSNTIGIEVVGDYDYGTEKWDPLTEEQIMSVSNLVNTLYKMYGLSYSDVYGHEELSAKTPGEGTVVKEAIESCVDNCNDDED